MKIIFIANNDIFMIKLSIYKLVAKVAEENISIKIRMIVRSTAIYWARVNWLVY